MFGARANGIGSTYYSIRTVVTSIYARKEDPASTGDGDHDAPTLRLHIDASPVTWCSTFNWTSGAFYDRHLHTDHQIFTAMRSAVIKQRHSIALRDHIGLSNPFV